MEMEETECSETPAYNIQTLWNYQQHTTKNIQHTEHDESLKSKTLRSRYSVYLIIWYAGWNTTLSVK
jgi:hypothetical protein